MTRNRMLGKRQGTRALLGEAIRLFLLAGLLAISGCRAGVKTGAKSPEPEAQPPPRPTPAQALEARAASRQPETPERQAESAAKSTPKAEPSEAMKLLDELLADERSRPDTQVVEAEPAPATAPVEELEKPQDSGKPAKDELEMQEALELLAKAAGPDEPAVTRSGPEKSEEAPKPADAPPLAPQAAQPLAEPANAPAPAPAPAPQPAAEPVKEEAKPVQVASAAGAPAAQATTPAPAPAPAPAAKPPRPAGKSEFYTFFHKNADDFLRFLDYHFPDYAEKGHVTDVVGKPDSVMFFGEDKVIQDLTKIADEYDDLGLKLIREILRPKYIDIAVVMESLNMAGIANVWHRVDENITINFHDAKGKVVKTATHKQSVYAKTGLAAGSDAPLFVPPKVPYIFEMPWAVPFEMPQQSTGKGTTHDQKTMQFNQSPSSEVRGTLVAVGTKEDITRIRDFLEEIDRPARRILIEIQLIELDASKFQDIGLDSFQLGQRHSIFGGSFNLPGEPLSQPGIPSARRPGDRLIVPPNVFSGLGYMFDDTTVDLSGRFMATVRLLETTGDAKVKARPKILALDDRQSVLHIGEEIPTFESTGVSREVTGGVFVENVNRVSTQYVGFTLNMRPKVSGENEDEVMLELELVSNRLAGRTRVFAEDLIGIPEVSRRRFIGETRVHNHRPIIIGGLIQEEESESVNKIPILGEIPVIKYLFSRTQSEERRVEVILVLTPHILSDKIPDRMATPKESMHFDTFDSVLFHDRYIIKGKDVQGIDPITKLPTVTLDGKKFTERDVIDLTLLKIVKNRKLVSKLGIFEEYLPVESREKLGWLKRKFPERSVFYWPKVQKEVYYKAAAIVIENIKELNGDLSYEELVKPRREIVLPTSPYRMTLSYDKYKILAEKGEEILRGVRVDLTPATVDLLQEIAETRTLREFADYIDRVGIQSTDHGELQTELLRLFQKLHPGREETWTEGYAQLYRNLADANIDFMVIATYFQENLSERYRTVGAPNIGTLEKDLINFLKTTITITQRAKRLQELDARWANLYTDDEEAEEVNWEKEPGSSE